MTARQRPAPGSAAVVPSAVPGNGTTNGAAAAFRWETWFAGATPDQRANALALARAQGLIYLNQLPAVAHHVETEAGRPSIAPLLARLLAGKTETLPSLDDESLAILDHPLDSLQREAVRRALAAPDLFLLQGLPGTGKSRVVIEIICQAARRGWRTLLLAPSAPAVDVVLERLLGCADVLPIRLLAPDERPDALPPALRGLTLTEQRRAFRERAAAGARQARGQAEETCVRRQREEALWGELLPLAERHAALSEQVDANGQRNAAISSDVEREAEATLRSPTAEGAASGPFAVELRAAHARSDAALSEWRTTQSGIDAKHDALRKDLDAVDAQLKQMDSRCAAREGGRWWTVAYWSGGSALSQRESLRIRHRDVERALRELEQAQARQQAARQQIEAKGQAERQDAIRAEVEQRRQVLREEESALRAEVSQIERVWESRCAGLQPIELRPIGYRSGDVHAAQERWREQRTRDDADCQFARQWADYLDQAGEQLAPRLPALANLLAGPIAALAHEYDGSGTCFDVLIVEDAEHLTEADLLRLAALAPRVVLVSQALRDGAPALAPGKGPRSLHGLPPAVMCWPRLWQAVADDLARLPYSWQREGDRLVCELAAVRPEDQRHLEREGLADAPEIELHILSLPRARPVLARVSFPGHFSIPEATRFIRRELDELPIQPLGRTAWWQETPDAWLLHLGPECGAATEAIEVDDGIRLELIGAGQPYAGRTARLVFARSVLPDRTAVQRWLTAKLHWRGRERGVFLQVPHRMNRPLAEVVGPLLFHDACLAALLPVRTPNDGRFEFVPVPTPRRPEWPREGAGLEQDLATGRHGDRLPPELRAELPRKGIVNYLEAQALVRRLEQWVHAPAELTSNGKGSPAVLVLALYEPQAQLLRQLAARSPALKSRSYALEIAVPGQVRQRECDVLVLSLTRSHTHRSVPLGEDVADLALALTRPRHRVLVFGDPGMLSKRSQWQGPLDHLDAADAHAEAVRVTRLLRHVQAAAPAVRS